MEWKPEWDRLFGWIPMSSPYPQGGNRMNGDAWQSEELGLTSLVRSSVIVKLNGEVIGSVEPDANLGEAVKRYAQERGLRSFIVLADGTKLGPEAARAPVSDHACETLEMYAKDTRGF